MESLLQDLRYALRRLRQAPGFATVAILIVALGIGANTAIFSIVNAVLFRPLPYERPDELVNVYVSDSRGREFATTSFPEFREFREQRDLFTGTIAFDMNVVTRIVDDGSSVLFAEYVTADYWDVLGLRPALGRGFLPEDDVPGSAPVVILSHHTWQRDFGADPGVVGTSVNLNGVPVTVVGVGPADYNGVVVGVTSQIWLPYGSRVTVAPAEGEGLESRTSRSTWVRARLRPGVTVPQVQAALDVLMTRLAAEYPASNEGRRVQVVPTADVRFHPAVDRALRPVAGLLMVVVGLVLAVACSNLANLLLARAAARQKETAVRLALGAGRGRLIRQFLVESLVLALAGGAAGLALAYALTQGITAFRPPLPVPIVLDLGIDVRVLAFTLVVSLATGTLFGLAPALRASRPDLVRSLKDEATSLRAGRRWFRLGNVLVVGQVAVSLLLLVAAGLFVRGLGRAQQVDPGFEARRVAILSLNLGEGPAERGSAFLRQLQETLRARPDVRAVAVADRVPLGFGIRTVGITVDGFTPPDGDELEVDQTAVGPGYFATLGIPLVRGREFTERDDSAARVAIVSEAMARRFWGKVDVVGRSLRLGQGPGVEIVGVARDTKVRTLGEAPRPYLYTPLDVARDEFVTVVAATAGDPGPVLAAMRRESRALRPDIPIFSATTMPQHLGIMLFLPRMGAALLSLFGVLAMMLAAIGLYGVIAFAVSRRTREIGIRMALGARAGQVARLVVGEGMALVAVGAVIGLALALVAARPLRGALYGVAPHDPVALAAVALILGGVAFLASYLPARRAARVEPIEALRHQ
jgi:predicted permease